MAPNFRREYGSHAEIGAMLNYVKDRRIKKRKKIDLLVGKIDRNANLQMSRPCCGCSLKLQRWEKYIRRVYWTTDDGLIDWCRVEDLIYN